MVLSSDMCTLTLDSKKGTFFYPGAEEVIKQNRSACVFINSSDLLSLGVTPTIQH